MARYADGRIIKGHTCDFAPDGPRFHLVPAARGLSPKAIAVALKELKALFFVRDFAGNPLYSERKEFGQDARRLGRPVEVVFGDGEVLRGYTMGYDSRRAGFFLFPADPQSNNLRVFAVSSAVRQVLSVGASGAMRPAESPMGGGGDMLAPKTIGDIRAVVSVLRQTVSDWEALVRAVEALTRDHAQLREHYDRLQREHRELGVAHEHLRHAYNEAARSLTELRAAHDALDREHHLSGRALQELRERHEAVLRDRESAAAELHTILRHLRG